MAATKLVFFGISVFCGCLSTNVELLKETGKQESSFSG
jgi:hypothetical protein